MLRIENEKRARGKEIHHLSLERKPVLKTVTIAGVDEGKHNMQRQSGVLKKQKQTKKRPQKKLIARVQKCETNQKQMGNATQKGKKKEEDRSVLVVCWKNMIFQNKSVGGGDK